MDLAWDVWIRGRYSDGDIVNNMYEPDPDLLAGQSAEEETEDSILSPIPMGPPSPFPTSEDFTPKEGSPYEAPVYIPEDIPIPPDFELRESSIPGAGLGIWAKRKMEIGERLGPYVVAPRAALKEADFGWESCDFLSCKNKSSDSVLETAAGPGKDHLVLMVSVTEFSRRQGEPSASLKMSDTFSSRLQDAQGEAGRLQRTGVYSEDVFVLRKTRTTVGIPPLFSFRFSGEELPYLLVPESFATC
ncbi:hypothetical protein ACRRTK_016146 [Alexandromys fortis]